MIYISIISVAKNNREGLEKTFKSIMGQEVDFSEIEWIVKDAGSDDQTVEFLKDVEKQQLLPNFTWNSSPDKGLYDGMNIAMTFMHGLYTIFLNSGDYLYASDVLAKTIRVIRDSKSEPPTFLLGDDLVANIDGQFVFRKSRDIKYLWHSLPCSHQAIFYNTKHINGLKYNLNYKICGDYQFTLEIYKNNYKSHRQLGFIVPVFVAGGHALQHPIALSKEAYLIKRDIGGTPFLVRSFSFLAGYFHNILMHYFPAGYNFHRRVFNKFVNPTIFYLIWTRMFSFSEYLSTM